MSSSVKLRLGTRRSPLALAQAEEARARLCAAHGWRDDAIELVSVVASGDKVLDRPLAEIGGKALWTRELDAWLAEGRIDAAVHSMKDVETLRPAAIAIGAILPRADVADVLVGAPSIAAIPPGARIGTSAPRRAAQMLHCRPDCRIVGLRGNVATRLAKLAVGEAEVTLLAAAGLDRLGEKEVGARLDPATWLPAPAQGAIGIEYRAQDAATRDLLAAIDHRDSRTTVMAERALLAALGGSCHSPVAVLTRLDGGWMEMTAAIFSPDGTERVVAEARFDRNDLDGARRLARALLEQAGPAVRRHFSGEA